MGLIVEIQGRDLLCLLLACATLWAAYRSLRCWDQLNVPREHADVLWVLFFGGVAWCILTVGILAVWWAYR